MNEKIQAILLKIILELKKMGWTAGPDWEITLKSEGYVPLVKLIPVEGYLNDKQWNDHVEIAMNLKLTSSDEVTFFPDYTIFGQISVEGGPNEDIASKMDADVAFTVSDYRKDSKLKSAAAKINRLIDDHIQTQYSNYIDTNKQEIEYQKDISGKSDDDR